jgi:hypothetical protein
MLSSWLRLTTATTMLAVEAQGVIGLRLAEIAAGRGSVEETQRMVAEKVLALSQAAAIVGGGGSGHRVVAAYRRAVRANARRLRRRADESGPEPSDGARADRV